jgi:hypothetical protein
MGSIFVTGGSGFIGLALCRLLRERFRDDEIVALARSDEASEALSAIGVRSVRGDLTAPIGYLDELRRARWVFHLGANSTFGDAGDYESVNVEATRALVEALKTSTALERLVFTSTIGAVDRPRADPCDRPLTVDAPAAPTSAYGRSKLACERLIRDAEIPFTIVRPSWVYGAGMRRTSHVAVLLKAAADGKLVSRCRWPGRVSVIHVSDLVRALSEIPLHPATAGKTCFADDGTPRSFGEIFERAHRLAGRGTRMLHLPRVAFWPARKLRGLLPFALGCLFADVLVCSDRLFADLRVQIRVSFDEGIQETWRYVTQVRRGTHVVTGAASGIGLAFARELTAAGRSLLLIDRSPSVEKIAAELGQAALQLDLARPESVARIARWIAGQGTFVEGLINCAGFGVRADLTSHSVTQIDEMARVNFIAPAQLCRLVLPQMKKHRAGYILNVASSISEVPLPGMAIYGATKAALYSLGRSLYGELRDSGVTVVTLLPSGTLTAFQSTAGVKVWRGGKGLMRPEQVARIGLRAVERRRGLVLIGWRSNLMVLVSRLLPFNAEVRMWSKMMAKMR